MHRRHSVAIRTVLVALLVVSPALAERHRSAAHAPTTTAPTPPPPAAVTAPPSTDANSSATVQLRPIDEATVRLFAISGIGMTEVQGDVTRTRRVLALPDAGHGSGVLVRRDGLVLTARHVVEGADIIAAVLPGEDHARPAHVVYVDPDHDIAFLRVAGQFPQAIALPATAPPLVALEHVSASGYPIEAGERFPAAASGELSRVNNDGRLQFAMTLNPGNSGGPIVDDSGRLVGIVCERGDPAHGVMGIIVAEPIGRILADWQSHVVNVPAPVTSDAEAAADREVASLAASILRAGPLGLVTDEAVHQRLVTLDRPDARPEVLALLAAHVWNALVVLVESNGATNMKQLRPELRTRADELLATVIDLCRRADAGDAHIREHYVFVRAVLQVVDNLAGEAGAASGNRACGTYGGACCATANPSAGTCGAGLACFGGRCLVPGNAVPAVYGPPPPPGPIAPTRGLFIGGLTLVTDDDTNAPSSVDGGAAMAGLLAQTLRLGRRAPFEFSVLAGGDVLGGYWRQGALLGAFADVGIRLSLGDRIAGTATVLYTPGVLYADGRTNFAYVAYRAGLGLRLNNVELGVSWQEIGRGGNATLRMPALWVEVGF